MIYINVICVIEFCQWERFSGNCTSNSVIVMTKADYGRMMPGRCAQEDHGHIGCQMVYYF